MLIMPFDVAKYWPKQEKTEIVLMPNKLGTLTLTMLL
jgi:hypothetical protein